MKTKLDVDTLLTIDANGMPQAPTIRQLIDKDIQLLYNRDKTKDKSNYIADCIVIYYLGDPKSPARQAGLNTPEALAMAIDQAGLPKDYVPDALVLKLIDRYYKETITEAGRVVENMQKCFHNINIAIDKINTILNDAINGTLTLEQIPTVLNLIDNVKKQAGEIPTTLKKLEEAKNNLMYETETQLSRGGNVVVSSMNAENYTI